ncbi:hypothetical protein [Streptomyces sp. NPDC047525]|uniref:hypothetical protein n=1 Tax=Streptomyces sp. NPDC047525 TaxID=3155264 RepID=UPI0033E47421
MPEQSSEFPEISPALKQGATKRNISAARKAVVVARYHAWTLDGTYNGSDTRSGWRCELTGCGVYVEKFYSHIRGRRDKEGNWKPSPRHDGCLPPAAREAALAEWRVAQGLSDEWLEEQLKEIDGS